MQIISTIPAGFPDPEFNTISTELQPSIIVYAEETKRKSNTTSSPSLWTISMVPNGYSDPDNKTLPTMCWQSQRNIRMTTAYSTKEAVIYNGFATIRGK